jgi:hypothetical protein
MKHTVHVRLTFDTDKITDADIIKVKNEIVKEIKLHGNRAGFIAADGESNGIDSYEFDTLPGKVGYMSDIFDLYNSGIEFSDIEAWGLTDESCYDFIQRMKGDNEE